MENSASHNSPWIIDATHDNFQAEVIDRSFELPVVVDFWAEWCQPCRMLAPLLEGLAHEFDGQFALVKANTEQGPGIAAQFQVQSIPAVFAVRGGQIVDFFNGLLPEPQLREWLKRQLPTPAERLVSQARGQSETNPQAAEEMLHAALDLEADLAPAKIALAELLLAGARATPERTAAAAQLIAELEARGFLEPEAEKLKAALELRQEGTASGDVESCREALAADPGNFTLRLALARSLAAVGQYEPALQQALELVQEDRHKTGEEARALMVDIFLLLPEESELTSVYRRKLSMALY